MDAESLYNILLETAEDHICCDGLEPDADDALADACRLICDGPGEVAPTAKADPKPWSLRTAQQVIADLPAKCYTASGQYYQPQELRLIEPGEMGYSEVDPQWVKVTLAAAPGMTVACLADRLNELHRVSDHVLDCMIAGSMFGWGTPAADPTNPANQPL